MKINAGEIRVGMLLEYKNDLWRLLESGQLVAVDFEHNCLLDIKHKEDQHLTRAKHYFEHINSWDAIVAAHQDH